MVKFIIEKEELNKKLWSNTITKVIPDVHIDTCTVSNFSSYFKRKDRKNGKKKIPLATALQSREVPILSSKLRVERGKIEDLGIGKYNNSNMTIVIFINITRLNTQLLKIINNIQSLKTQQKIFLIGISTISRTNPKNKNKLYKMGIDIILNCPIKKKDITILFNVITQKL